METHLHHYAEHTNTHMHTSILQQLKIDPLTIMSNGIYFLSIKIEMIAAISFSNEQVYQSYCV